MLMHPYVVTRDSQERWVAAEMHEEPDQYGTVTCVRTLHRLAVTPEATREEAEDAARALALYKERMKVQASIHWSPWEEALAASSLTNAEVAALTGRNPKAVQSKRTRMRSKHVKDH